MLMHEDLQTQDKGCGKDARHIHAAADRHADGGDCPDTGGSGQALGGVADVAVDDPDAEEADAADDLRRDPGWVRPFGAGEFHTADHQIREPVFRDDHEQAGGGSDDAVGADACALQTAAPLKADHRTAGGGQDDADEDDELLIHGERRRKCGLKTHCLILPLPLLCEFLVDVHVVVDAAPCAVGACGDADPVRAV